MLLEMTQCRGRCSLATKMPRPGIVVAGAGVAGLLQVVVKLYSKPD